MLRTTRSTVLRCVSATAALPRVAARVTRTSTRSYSLNRSVVAAPCGVVKGRAHIVTVRAMSSMPASGATLDLPALSPTMENGVLAKWHKKVGDLIKPGDVVAEIETDKAVVGFEAQEEYYLAAILVPEGSPALPVGTPLGITVEEEADIAAAQAYAESLSGAAPAAPATPAPAAAAPAVPASAPATPTPVASAAPVKPAGVEAMELPALSPTMEQGTLAKWHKKEGDFIKPGDLIAEIETDKAVVGFEAQDEYYLAAIMVEGGSAALPVGTPVAFTVETEADIPAAKAYAEALKAAKNAPAALAAPAAPAAAPAPAAAAPASTGKAGTYDHLMPLSPAVAHLVHSNHIDISTIKPTGPKGRLLKGDVLAAMESGSVRKIEKAAPAAPAAAATAVPAPLKATGATKPAAPAAAALPGMSARRAAARTYVDVPISAPTQTYNAATVVRKQNVPHLYMQSAISLGAINSFIGTYAKEVTATAVIMKVIAKAVSGIMPHVSIAAPFTATVYDASTNTSGTVAKANTASISTFQVAATDAGMQADTALLALVLQGNNVSFSAELLRNNSVVCATIAPPTVKTVIPDLGAVSTDAQVLVSVTFDASRVGEDEAAECMDQIKALAENPVALFL